MRTRIVALVVVLSLPFLGCDPQTNGYDVQVEIQIVAPGSGTVTAVDGTGSVVCPPDCLLDRAAALQRITLTAAPATGYRFDHWETIPGETCVEGQPTTPTIVVPFPETASATGLIGCIAVFVADPPATGDWWAVNIAAPHTGFTSVYKTIFIPFVGRFVFLCDQDAAVPADVVDGCVIAAQPPAAKPGTKAAPTSASQLLLPGISPFAGAGLADGSIAIGGRKMTAPAGTWIARLGTDDQLAWQANVTGVANITHMVEYDGTHVLVLGEIVGNQDFIAQLDDTGAFSNVTTFNTTAFPYALTAMTGGGYAFATSVFVNPDRNTSIVLVDDLGAITWQKNVSGGFASVEGLADAGDGGVIAFGRIGATGSTAAAWIARFDATGATTWQKTYGAADAVNLASVVPTATGFRAIGSASGGFLVMDLAGDGTLSAATSYKDTGGAGDFVMDAYATSDGGVAMGARSGQDTFDAIVTADDGTVGGCGDTGIGASVDTSTIAVADATATIADTTLIATSVAAFTTTATTVAPAATTQAPTDLCTN